MTTTNTDIVWTGTAGDLCALIFPGVAIHEDSLDIQKDGTKCYAGTTIRVRHAPLTAIVSVNSEGRIIDGDGEWLSDRINGGCLLGARQMRRVRSAV